MTGWTDLVCSGSGNGVRLGHDLMLWPSGASLLATVGSFIHTLPFSSAAKGGNTQYTLPFALAWLMPELFSPHFIWWSSASSLPRLLIRHGSPHSPTSLSPPPSLPSFLLWSQFCLKLPPSLHPSFPLCPYFLLTPPLLSLLTHFHFLPPFSVRHQEYAPFVSLNHPAHTLYPHHYNSHYLSKKTGEVHSMFALPPQWMAHCHSST